MAVRNPKNQPSKIRRYTMPLFPTALPVGAQATIDGHLIQINNSGKPILVNSKSRRVGISANRIYGTVGKDTTANRTAQLIQQAPDHFDAVRINLLSAASEGNAWKVTVAPSAKFNQLGPVDQSNAAITPTVVTFGSTDQRNPRNPGGGATTITSTSASGSAASNTLIQDRIRSDIIQISSLARVDDPNKKPLIYVRIYGTNIPLSGIAEMADNSANPLKNVIGDYYSGYSNGDYSLTNPSFWSQYGAPMLEIEFFLRGKLVRNIGITGDSTDQGWVDATAVPQFGGNINGYMRRFVELLRADGEPVGFSCFAQAGQKSFMTYNNALPAIMSGELTHLVIRPFSVNDRNDGTTAAIANAAIKRTSMLISACKEYGVVPIVLRPFNVGVSDSIQYPIVNAFVDSFKSSGGLVLDFTSLVNKDTVDIKSEYMTLNSSGGVVDRIHPNNQCHQDIANWIYSKAYWIFT